MMSEYDEFEGPSIQVIGGRIFYSPNSSRTVEFPPVDTTNIGPINIFLPRTKSPSGRFNVWDLQTFDYLQPRFWSRPFGWISFFPLIPQFMEPPFACLLAAPRHARPISNETTSEGYTLPDEILSDWLDLDRSLMQATALLQSYYEIPSVRPLCPWTFGYAKTHKSRRTMTTSINKGRDWFTVWVALFSYTIARAETIELELSGYPSLEKVNWQVHLLNNGFERTWIDYILRSMVCSAVPRAGTFIHLPPLDDSQPTVEWLVSRHVPVWYPWENTQASNPEWSHLAPPIHLLQEATTNITRSLSPLKLAGSGSVFNIPSSQSIDLRSATNTDPITCIGSVPETYFPSTDIVDGRRLRPSWSSFFASLAERRSRILQHESEQDKQRRLARERNPPITSAKVFHWEKVSPDSYTREAVPQRWRRSTLEDYSETQKKYNSIDNEWDCCTEFGSDLEGDDSDTEDETESLHNQLIVDATEVVETNAPLKPAPSRFTPFSDYDEDRLQPSATGYGSLELSLQEEVLTTSHLIFGYLQPLPSPSQAPPLPQSLRKNTLKLLGLSAYLFVDVFSQPLALLVFDFLRRFCSNQDISTDEWDLSRENRACITFSTRFSTIRKLQSKSGDVYMFDLGKKARQKWSLAATTARHALLICRLDPRMQEDEIARYLATNGIPFRTLQNSATIQRAVRPRLQVQYSHPFRPLGYTFSLEDYRGYIEQTRFLLTQPRSRAAVMKGGYLWRVSISRVSIEAIISGPCGWSPNREEMFIASSPDVGEFIDDELTESEVEALCGVYRCATGVGKQTSTKSWCPLPGAFQNSGLDYGQWTTDNEELFQIADSDGKVLKRQPCPATQWRNILRGLGVVRRGSMRLEEASKQLLDTSSCAIVQ